MTNVKMPAPKAPRQGTEMNFGGTSGGGPPVRMRPDGAPSLTPTPSRRVILPVQ